MSSRGDDWGNYICLQAAALSASDNEAPSDVTDVTVTAYNNANLLIEWTPAEDNKTVAG